MFSQGGIGNIAKTNKKPIPTRPGNLTSALLILAIRVFQRRWGAWIQNCLILMISNSIFLNYLDQPQGIVERLAHRFAKIRCKLLSSKARATLAQLVERLIRNVLVRIRLRVFSAIYGGLSRVRRHHLGAVGKVLGKEMGNEFSRYY
jgi:hypothetical protein